MWEQGALTIELQRFDPTWRRVKCDQLGCAINAGRSKRRNGSYSGKAVQRLYLVDASDQDVSERIKIRIHVSTLASQGQTAEIMY